MTNPNLPLNVETYHQRTYRLLLTIIVWLFLGKLISAPTEISLLGMLVGFAVFGLLHSLILFFFVPGVRQGNPRTAVWLSYVLMVYFVVAVTRVGFSHAAGIVALIECLLISALFFCAIRYVKFKRATQNGEL
jgi:uncharacterized membrane protein